MNFNIDELELIHFADPRMNVRPPAFDFEKDGDKAEELADVLYKKMLQLGGVGLSANQVGLPYRMPCSIPTSLAPAKKRLL
jgi:peptide deformylase